MAFTSNRRLEFLGTLAGVISCLAGCQSSPLPVIARRVPAVQLSESDIPSEGNSAAIARLPRVDRGDLVEDVGSPPKLMQVAFQDSDDKPNQIRPPEELALPQPGPDGLLSLGELEQIALASNPALAEARARIEAVRGKWVQVGLLPNTELGYSGQQLGSNGQAEQQGLYIAQEFVRGGKLNFNRAIVAQEIHKAEQVWVVEQMRVLTDVRLAYYQVLVAQRRSDIAKQLVDIAQQSVDTAEALQKAQEVSKLDTIRSRVELQTAELLLKNAKNLHTAAWSRLTAVLGSPGLTRQPIDGDLELSLDDLDPQQVFAKLVAESPEMAAALIEVQRARAAVDRAYAEPTPNVDVQAIVQHDNSTGAANANLQVSVPIPWLNRNQGGIRQAKAEVDAAARAVDRLELSFQERLASVYQRYASARNQVQDYSRESGILENAASALDLVRQGYQAGELSYLDLITAQRTYSQTNLAYIEALGEWWSAKVEIDGLLLKGSLSSNIAP